MDEHNSNKIKYRGIYGRFNAETYISRVRRAEKNVDDDHFYLAACDKALWYDDGPLHDDVDSVFKWLAERQENDPLFCGSIEMWVEDENGKEIYNGGPLCWKKVKDGE